MPVGLGSDAVERVANQQECWRVLRSAPRRNRAKTRRRKDRLQVPTPLAVPGSESSQAAHGASVRGCRPASPAASSGGSAPSTPSPSRWASAGMVSEGKVSVSRANRWGESILLSIASPHPLRPEAAPHLVRPAPKGDVVLVRPAHKQQSRITVRTAPSRSDSPK